MTVSSSILRPLSSELLSTTEAGWVTKSEIPMSSQYEHQVDEAYSRTESFQYREKEISSNIQSVHLDEDSEENTTTLYFSKNDE